MFRLFFYHFLWLVLIKRWSSGRRDNETRSKSQNGKKHNIQIAEEGKSREALANASFSLDVSQHVFVLHWFLNSVFLVKKKNKYCDSTTIPITKVTSVKNNPNMIFFFCSAPNERHNEPFAGIPSLQIFWKRSGPRYHANTICSFMCRFLFFFYKRKKENELHGASFSGRAPTGPLFLSKASAKTNSAQRALLKN